MTEEMKEATNNLDELQNENSLENEEVNIENESDNQDVLKELERKTKECEEYLELIKRTKAEFDNFRKRTQKEKEVIYDDGFAEAIKNILPVLDNLERAISSTNERTPLYEGLEMTLKLFKDTLTKIGVEEIPALNEKFDPNVHNAVMHIEDENLEENIIVEEFLKGYKYKDKIIRYSMVKVAN